MRRLLIMLLSSAVCATTGLGQGAITLRPAAVVGEGPVTLGQVAELSGREALALADVVVAPDAAELVETDGWRRLELSAVRAALEAHEAPWGTLSLRGGACAIRIEEGAALQGSARPIAHGGRAGAREFETGTVGAMVIAQLARFLAVEAQDLRVTFDEGDQAALARAGEGLVVDARPTGLGARTPIAIRIYRGDWIETETSVRAQIEVRRPVATTRRDLRRGEVIRVEDVSLGEAWLTPDVAPAEGAAAVGAVARSAIGAGKIVMQTDVEAPLVVRRRDPVTVDIVSGTITVQVKMRAMGDGRVGDVILFESMEPDRRDRRQIEARVNGGGRAVAVVGGSS